MVKRLTMTLSTLRSSHRQLVLALCTIVGLNFVEPALNPSVANACFFWQSSCRSGQASNTQAGGVRTTRILGGNNDSIPYVISPRNAWIQQPGPTNPYAIRWNPVVGAESYTIRLWQWNFERDQPNFVLWETVENTNETEFPNLVLSPGSYYSIEVVTDSIISSNSDEGFYKSGFQLLFEEDYDVLASNLAEVTPSVATSPGLLENTLSSVPTNAVPADGVSINDIGSSTVNTDAVNIDANIDTIDVVTETEDKLLAQAGVYFLEEMYADALTILQPLAANPTASEWVYTALGDTYSQTGLNQLAIEAYDQALTIAVRNTNTLGEAINRVNLANVYATRRSFEDALQQLTLARQLYNTLQAEIEVTRLDRRIQLLTRLVSHHSYVSPSEHRLPVKAFYDLADRDLADRDLADRQFRR